MNHFSLSKVHQGDISIGPNDDILGLNISMANSLGMNVIETIHKLSEDAVLPLEG